MARDSPPELKYNYFFFDTLHAGTTIDFHPTPHPSRPGPPGRNYPGRRRGRARLDGWPVGLAGAPGDASEKRR